MPCQSILQYLGPPGSGCNFEVRLDHPQRQITCNLVKAGSLNEELRFGTVDSCTDPAACPDWLLYNGIKDGTVLGCIHAAFCNCQGLDRQAWEAQPLCSAHVIASGTDPTFD